MMHASFAVDISDDNAQRFAELSGDWNPLHTDAEYAATTIYRRPLLHGAFAAGLFSRMAGMHLPGKSCLLHGMRLRFIMPIMPPAALTVTGRVVRGTATNGSVEITIADANTGMLYVEGSYDFGTHEMLDAASVTATQEQQREQTGSILVTGSSGGLGRALLGFLGERGRPLARHHIASFGKERIDAIVHCGWPRPIVRRLTALGESKTAAIQHHIAEPLEQMVDLAKLLQSNGNEGAALIVIGSSFAEPGRHAFQQPLYSLGKSMIPVLTRILALELAETRHRALGVVFDVLTGSGMNEKAGRSQLLAHGDRSPSGVLASIDEAAMQIEWLLANRSRLVSGSMINMTGGSLP